MKMADRYCQSVGRIMRLGNGFQSEQQADHFLNLAFVGIAVSDDCLFDQPRAVLSDLKAFLFRQQKYRSADLS